MKSLGIVFPGQGSQTIGMLADIAKSYPEVTKIYAEASDVLGYDLWKLTQEGPSELLDQTVHTQPAILAGSYAIWRILESNKKIRPALFAGHSLGEYTALTCAGAFSFKDAIKLVAARGQYMQDAVPAGEGALAAIIGLEDDKVTELCKQAVQAHEVLTPANFNSPGQVVVAGHKIAVERMLVLAKDAGARMAKLLPVSVSSHCALMKSAADQLKKLLATIDIQVPSIPVLNNVDVTYYENAEAIRDGLTRQLCMPVRWVETIQKFAAEGIQTIIECGPGKVLTGLNKRIVTEIQLTPTADLVSLQSLLDLTLKTG